MEVNIFDEEDDIIRYCYCKDHCPPGTKNGTCLTKPGGKCFTAVEVDVDENGEEYPLLTYGCLPPNQMAFIQCNAKLLLRRERKTITCCDRFDFCNKYMLPVMPKTEINWGYGAIIGFGASIGVCLILMIIFYLTVRKYEKKIKQKRKNRHSDVEAETVVNLNNIVNLHCAGEALELVDRPNLSSMQSSTGVTLNALSQLTISREVQINNLIGKGKFGRVFNAKWRGESVAIKIFFPSEEKYWLRESEIYQTVMMRHENILGYVATDIKISDTETQMLLITDYHSKGSLNQYLSTNTLTKKSLLNMSIGLASGLNHLHTEFSGVRGKPAIAIRTLKSPNILVKANGDCCISDFGSAVKFLDNTQTIQMTTEDSKLEMRYRAPEVIEETPDIRTNFESLKMADIYSFSLILWEMSQRTQIETENEVFVGQYRTPYEHVPDEEIKEFVCIRKLRPEIPEIWREDKTLNVMTKVIEESWNSTPTVRLTALRIKKTLSKMQSEESSNSLN